MERELIQQTADILHVITFWLLLTVLSHFILSRYLNPIALKTFEDQIVC